MKIQEKDNGHSGSSAPYAVNLFKKLAMFKPIGPITGKDSEWAKTSTGDNSFYKRVIQKEPIG